MAGRKLKVFEAQFGFYDTVVAAPSQAAALEAWGTHQNLFADGAAKIATDEAAIAAALKHPETPLRRAVGSGDPFLLEPISLPKLPETPKTMGAKPPMKSNSGAPAKPSADRSKLDAAEKALRVLDEARKNEEARFQHEADELEARREAAQSAYVKTRKTATVVISKARSLYRDAGGSH